MIRRKTSIGRERKGRGSHPNRNRRAEGGAALGGWRRSTTALERGAAAAAREKNPDVRWDRRQRRGATLFMGRDT